MQFSSKALLRSAFVFFSLCVFSWFFFSNASLASDCPAPANAQSVTVLSAYDGDTLRLQDGRKLRLIGINTPELGRDGQPDQPLAKAATEALRQLIRGANPLALQIGTQPQDHYGRVLGHLFLSDGRNLEAELLKQGLGFAINLPPNLALRDCLNRAENVARAANLGVWAESYYRPQHVSTLDSRSGGFGRFIGEVSRAGAMANGNYLELNGKIFLPIQGEIDRELAAISSDDLLGRKLEVRGWLIARQLTKRQKIRGFLPFMLKINHIDNLRLCDTDC